MADKEKLLQLIGDFNDSGLDMITKFVQMFDGVEEYNIHTTPERLEELKQIEEHERIQYAEKEGKEQEIIMYDRAATEYARQREFKESLTGKEKIFFDKIKGVKVNKRYCMRGWELDLLVNTYKNNLTNGLFDTYCCGYMRGQRYERSRRKKVKVVTIE